MKKIEAIVKPFKLDEVLAYCQAPAAEGGSGALLVLLKSR